jgi:hypothetical protein
MKDVIYSKINCSLILKCTVKIQGKLPGEMSSDLHLK